MPKVVQINLRHSRLASDNLNVLLSEEDIDVGLIQEPWVYEGAIKGLDGPSHQIFYKKTNGKPRSCIIIKSHIKAFLCSNLSSPDVTVVSMEVAGGKHILISSIYMAHNEEAPPHVVRNLVVESTKSGKGLLMGCDANARHTLWGSREINERGESLFDFILSTKLLICNKGNKPTFVFPSSDKFKGWEEVIDVTLMTHCPGLNIHRWRVSEQCSFSDHNLIFFEITIEIVKPIPFRNPRKTNWEKFSRIAVGRLKNSPQDAILDTNGLDKMAESLENAMSAAFMKSCPVIRSKKVYPKWWNRDLSELRKKTRKVFNECYISKSWAPYKMVQREYKQAIRRAKKVSWEHFCESIDNLKDSCRLGKILSKDHTNPSFIRRLDGTWTESSEQTIQTLMETHFPGCRDISDQLPITTVEEITPNPGIIEHIVTEEKISWAISSFSPYKSPGPDGIIPIMMQKLQVVICRWLKTLFIASLRFNYIPCSWRKVKVIFIPKIGRSGHDSTKDFRPISLSSFILKTLERILDEYIRSSLINRGLSSNQHAYMKGKSTETALHEVVRTVERSLYFKQFTMAAFLDIEGAFNNVSTDSITQSLTRLGIDSKLIVWIESMLNTRIIQATWGTTTIRKTVCRGTPQGGVISPLLWIVVMDTLLVNLENLGVKVVAYADDVVVMVSGPFLSVISDIMENALGEINSWATGCGLGINPSKTELLLFTTKSKIPQYRLPSLGGQELKLSNTAKYLGVILDSKLNWKYNIEQRIKKAYVAFYACKKTFGKTWGLQPGMVLWMYTAVIRPILTYGALVWWEALEKGCNKQKMNRIQRTACVGVTGAIRTCPTDALNTMLNLLPIDLFVKSTATKSALRLREIKCWKSRKHGHSNLLNIFPHGQLPKVTDFGTTSLDFHRTFGYLIPTREVWENNSPLLSSDIEVYTDGSKMTCGVGAGIHCLQPNISLSLRLPDHSSVFQAEVAAIGESCKQLFQKEITGKSIHIFSDSQAAIIALSSTHTNSKLVIECKKLLNELGTVSAVTLIWVPGHRDIAGNEKADELARLGSGMDISLAIEISMPFGGAVYLIEQHFRKVADKFWRELTTCKRARSTWPSYDKKRTDILISNNRINISRITAVLTGHWAIGKHAARLGLHYRRHCRSCDDETEEETPEHYLLQCPALSNVRIKTMGKPIFDDLKDIGNIDISSILKYINKTFWT